MSHLEVKMRIACVALALVSACGTEEADRAPVHEAPVHEAEEPPPEPPSDLACAQVIVVAWRGATAAAATVVRTEEEAHARALEIAGRLDAGEDFAAVARADSDASSSGPRGGLLGTYTRDDWPAAHVPIRDAVFGLTIGQTSDVLSAPYGYVIARRCPVELVHTRHILIRYSGARNAPDEITRDRDRARAIAERVRQQIEGGADFATLARDQSEDGSADEGGDLGTLGRGRLAAAYEEAAFALAPNAIAPVVETEFGFHIIQRMPD